MPIEIKNNGLRTINGLTADDIRGLSPQKISTMIVAGDFGPLELLSVELDDDGLYFSFPEEIHDTDEVCDDDLTSEIYIGDIWDYFPKNMLTFVMLKGKEGG